MLGLATLEKTRVVPEDAATVVRVGDAHVAKFAASHESMAYATTPLDGLAVHARVISFAPVRREKTFVGGSGPAGVELGDDDDDDDDDPDCWFASACAHVESLALVVRVTPHAPANCAAPADCVASSDVLTPSQKHPFAFQATIAPQHAVPPGAATHGARSLAFVEQCVPGAANAPPTTRSAMPTHAPILAARRPRSRALARRAVRILPRASAALDARAHEKRADVDGRPSTDARACVAVDARAREAASRVRSSPAPARLPEMIGFCGLQCEILATLRHRAHHRATNQH